MADVTGRPAPSSRPAGTAAATYVATDGTCRTGRDFSDRGAAKNLAHRPIAVLHQRLGLHPVPRPSPVINDRNEEDHLQREAVKDGSPETTHRQAAPVWTTGSQEVFAQFRDSDASLPPHCRPVCALVVVDRRELTGVAAVWASFRLRRQPEYLAAPFSRTRPWGCAVVHFDGEFPFARTC